MDGLVLFIVVAVALVAAVWAVALAVSGGMVIGVCLLRGYLGGTMLRLIGLSLLTLAIFPVGLGAALFIGWMETRELNAMTEDCLRRR
jgi:hypothetical protein